MYQESIAIFNDSFDRCSKDPAFLDRFYEFFLACSEEVREKFTDTNMKDQKDVLMISLSYMMMAHKDPKILYKTAEKHNVNNRNIPPHLYVYWLDSMIRAVQITDIQFDHSVERAWRVILEPGINYMIEQYQQ